MMTAGLTYARSFTDKFSAGVTGNFIHEGLADLSQQTFAFDIGTLYDVGTLGMKIGMAIQNMGSQIKFIDHSARIPAIFRVGTSATLFQSADQKFIGSFEFSHPPDNAERMNVGGEYSFHKLPVPARRLQHQLRRRRGSPAGVGFHFPVSVAGKADLDYAYTDMKDLGAVAPLLAALPVLIGDVTDRLRLAEADCPRAPEGSAFALRARRAPRRRAGPVAVAWHGAAGHGTRPVRQRPAAVAGGGPSAR